MSTTLSKLQDLSDDSDEVKPFGPYQEEAIISLALDHPEFFTSVGRFMKPEMFSSLECRWVIAEILNSFEKHNVVPPRPLLRDKMVASLTEDDPWQRVLELVDRPSNPREVPIIKDTLLRWAQDRAYGLIYSEEAQDAYARGDYEELEAIVESANRIADVGQQAFWFLDNYEILFEPDIIDHKTTGFPSLDRKLNNGGPSAKEVCCWLAATNVGKCHTLKSKIIERDLSRIFDLELEDGTVIQLAGFREIQTARGMVKVCDLTDEDEIADIPTETDGTIELQDLRISNVGGYTSEYYNDSSP
jgi:hypothetical protein